MHFRNILWNFLGLSLPLLVALIAIPPLVTHIGPERFGLLALAWGLIGYAGALDLGVGRAVTQNISLMRGTANECEVPNLITTAIRVTSVTGAVSMGVIFVAAAWGVGQFIKTDNVGSSEIQISIFLLGLALPMQAISATYRGVNEAYLNFKEINLLRVILGIATFGAPYLVSLFTNKLHWLVATLLASRFLALIFYRHFADCCLIKAGNYRVGKYTEQFAHRLLHFGGWYTVSSIVGPMLVQADRFMIGGIISASAVTLYVLPFEVATQSLLVVGAITSISFPVISNLIHGSPKKAMALFHLWLYRIVGIMLILVLLLMFSMPTLLSWWVGGLVSIDSVRVGQIICIGVFFNAIGAMYYSLLHAQGHTKATAILHTVEFPVYIGILIVLINEMGIIGCAVAWAIRTFCDTTAMVWLAKRNENRKRL